MGLSIAEQIKNEIEKAKNILLVAHAKMDGDTLSAALAMDLILKKIGKKTTVACADPVPEIFSFLPATGEMRRDFEKNSELVISVDCSKITPKKLRWKKIGDELKIFIAAEKGNFLARDVSIAEGNSFDLILSLDAADKKQLGAIFEENAELFATTPLIVFDHHASNDGFGTINLIDTTAASTTEVLFDFLPTLLGDEWKKKIDPNIATLLLTGIITDTGSFQNPNTTPKSLEVAADLVELGARQQEIIRNVFKTKDIATLKLWGRVLSKIKTDPVHRLLWSTVSADDLADTGGKIEDLDGIVDELLSTAPGMEMVILIKERDDGVIAGSVRTTTPACDAAAFSAEFGGGGHTQAAGFKIRGKTAFEIVVGEIIAAAQKFQRARLGISKKESDDFSAAPPIEIVEPKTKVLKNENLKNETFEKKDENLKNKTSEISENEKNENPEKKSLKNENPETIDENPAKKIFPPTPEKDFVEIPDAEKNASPEKAEKTAFSEMQKSVATDAARAAAPEIPHEEFAAMLEKMMDTDPTKNISQ